MATPPICDFGWKAPDFTLPDLNGRPLSLADVRGPKGTLVMFICNHCPYVKAIAGLIERDVAALRDLGIGAVGIMSNDYRAYPEDSPEHMQRFATSQGFSFPYLLDESQAVARAYDAVCTPDFFGFDASGGLQYRGRLDASKTALVPNARRDLYEAMKLVAETGHGPRDQFASMGCSIKWRYAA